MYLLLFKSVLILPEKIREFEKYSFKVLNWAVIN